MQEIKVHVQTERWKNFLKNCSVTAAPPLCPPPPPSQGIRQVGGWVSQISGGGGGAI